MNPYDILRPIKKEKKLYFNLGIYILIWRKETLKCKSEIQIVYGEPWRDAGVDPISNGKIVF
jgi:hypothetical protein